MAYLVSGHATFCDDVREEVLGRHTLVGVVFGDIQVPHFPIVIPKLGISATAYQPLDRLKAFRLQVDVQRFGGEVVVIGDYAVDPSFFPGPDLRTPPPSDGVRKSVAQMHLVLSPLSLEASCRLRVVALCEGESNVLGEVDFVQAHEDDKQRAPYRQELTGMMRQPLS